MSISQKNSAKRRETIGLIAGVSCFTIWGLIPIYWKLIGSVPASEILAHRFVWTSIFLSLVLTWQKRWGEVVANVRSRRSLLYCLTGGLAISSNWFLFIWAVIAGRVVETSLGYFMTPLMNVLFGALFLRERLTRWQFVSVLLAGLGVLNLTFGYGRFPWIAVLLCVSFGLYGLLRKQSGTAAIPGLFIETILLLPFAIVFLIYLQQSNALVFGRAGWWLSIVLVSTGIITAVPLLWFGYATQHLRLITVGFLQYLSPIGSFFLGVFLYHEPFTRGHLVTFALIWIALAIFSIEAVLRWRSTRVREIDTCAFEASALD
ncbi:MAG TPA: EamA family transporter RarD [Chthoniobacterales bacterium]|jgi:chloramphenicol-sensitive protein RarD|nr:EamA family transporter RarD [Chthoniobacterales bacterium]